MAIQNIEVTTESLLNAVAKLPEKEFDKYANYVSIADSVAIPLLHKSGISLNEAVSRSRSIKLHREFHL